MDSKVPIAPDKDQLAKAEEIRLELKRRYGISPYLSGSMALGLGLPGKADYDYAVVIKSLPKFRTLTAKLDQKANPSPFNKPDRDHFVYQLNISGEPVDLAVTYGNKAKARRLSVEQAKLRLEVAPEKREKILRNKQRLKGALLFPELRYKLYKKSVDKELGLFHFGREKIKEASIKPRKDLYGHRTHNLKPIVESNAILSAHEAASRGLLQQQQSHNPLSLFRTPPTGEFRDQVFITKGLLPASPAYGNYGILFRKRNVNPSIYLNLVPQEHTTNKVDGKLTFVVPDEELAQWQSDHPDHEFMGESSVPDELKLPHYSVREGVSRLKHGLNLRNSTKTLEDKEADLPQVKGLAIPRLFTPRIGHGQLPGKALVNPFSGNKMPAPKTANVPPVPSAALRTPHLGHLGLGVGAVAGTGVLAHQTVKELQTPEPSKPELASTRSLRIAKKWWQSPPSGFLV